MAFDDQPKAACSARPRLRGVNEAPLARFDVADSQDQGLPTGASPTDDNRLARIETAHNALRGFDIAAEYPSRKDDRCRRDGSAA